MLRALRVRDLATVADVTLELGPGLNVLTGETGAGKSMLVGDRADRAAVRPGASRSVVEGEFDGEDPALRARLAEAGLDGDDRLVIRREVSAEGRSRAWVNGSPTTIGVLADLEQGLPHVRTFAIGKQLAGECGNKGHGIRHADNPQVIAGACRCVDGCNHHQRHQPTPLCGIGR